MYYSPPFLNFCHFSVASCSACVVLLNLLKQHLCVGESGGFTNTSVI